MHNSSVFLTFAPGIVMKGDQSGKKLFAVTLVTEFDEDDDMTTIWTEIWRGRTLKSVEKEVEEAVTKEKDMMEEMMGGETRVEHVVEIGSLR